MDSSFWESIKNGSTFCPNCIEFIRKNQKKAIIDIYKNHPINGNYFCILLDFSNINNFDIEYTTMKAIYNSIRNNLVIIVIVDRKNEKLMNLLKGNFSNILSRDDLRILFNTSSRDNYLPIYLRKFEGILNEVSDNITRNEFRILIKKIMDCNPRDSISGDTATDEQTRFVLIRNEISLRLENFYYNTYIIWKYRGKEAINPITLKRAAAVEDQEAMFYECRQHMKNRENIMIPKTHHEVFSEKLSFCKENIKNPIISPICYYEAIRLEPESAITLMQDYIVSSHTIKKDNRIRPLKLFMKMPNALNIFDSNIKVFLRDVLLNILKFEMKNDFEEVGIRFEIENMDSSGDEEFDREEIEDFALQIRFSSKYDEKYYSYELLKENLDGKIKYNLSLILDKNRGNNINQEISELEENVKRRG